MSDKSVWQGLGDLVGGWGKSSAKPLPTGARRCEAGHPMAADWVTCPYCEAERNAGRKTRASGDEEPDAAPVPAAGPGTTRVNPPEPTGRSPAGDRGSARGPRETTIDPLAGDADEAPPRPPDPPEAMSRNAGDGGGRRETRVLRAEGPVALEAQRRSRSGRRLTGILVTFSWSPFGELYKVYEGRNFGGSGTIAAEGGRDADILVATDDMMSNSHFLILCQGGQGEKRYRISDCNSTNGTYVNDQLIDSLGIDLVDGAKIYAGATLLTFKKLTPPSAEAAKPPAGAPAPPRQREERSEDDDESRTI